MFNGLTFIMWVAVAATISVALHSHSYNKYLKRITAEQLRKMNTNSQYGKRN